MHMLNGQIFLIQIIFFQFLLLFLNIAGSDFYPPISEIQAFSMCQFASLAFLHEIGGHGQQKAANCGIQLRVGLKLLPSALTAYIKHILSIQHLTVIFLVFIEICLLYFFEDYLVEDQIEIFQLLGHLPVHGVQLCYRCGVRGMVQSHLGVHVDQELLEMHLADHSHQLLQAPLQQLLTFLVSLAYQESVVPGLLLEVDQRVVQGKFCHNLHGSQRANEPTIFPPHCQHIFDCFGTTNMGYFTHFSFCQAIDDADLVFTEELKQIFAHALLHKDNIRVHSHDLLFDQFIDSGIAGYHFLKLDLQQGLVQSILNYNDLRTDEIGLHALDRDVLLQDHAFNHLNYLSRLSLQGFYLDVLTYVHVIVDCVELLRQNVHLAVAEDAVDCLQQFGALEIVTDASDFQVFLVYFFADAFGFGLEVLHDLFHLIFFDGSEDVFDGEEKAFLVVVGIDVFLLRLSHQFLILIDHVGEAIEILLYLLDIFTAELTKSDILFTQTQVGAVYVEVRTTEAEDLAAESAVMFPAEEVKGEPAAFAFETLLIKVPVLARTEVRTQFFPKFLADHAR